MGGADRTRISPQHAYLWAHVAFRSVPLQKADPAPSHQRRWCLPPSYGCGGCRILQARAAGQYVGSAGLVKTTAAPSAMKGVRNDRRARSSSVARLKPDRMLERCS
jgi:hypothetical protein